MLTLVFHLLPIQRKMHGLNFLASEFYNFYLHLMYHLENKKE